ncbi:MAG: RNA methyltransferase [Ottowia sp.]|nr:RNA methyltransferase [Ottowia sp.]
MTPATRFILIEPSHAGNVGAAARAMKVMGFGDLVLVRPRWPNVLRRQETIQRASGAGDVLAAARCVQTLDEALDGMTHLCATVMTPRDFGPPTFAPREHFAKLLEKPPEMPQGVALLFGCERFGMSNQDVYRCHAALSIPTASDYGSLNLAAAVQLIAYDWRQALQARLGSENPEKNARNSKIRPENMPADAQQLAAMLQHWQSALADIGFLDPATPRKLMPRLHQLFARAAPTHAEIHILRGIARAMQDAARQGGG